MKLFTHVHTLEVLLCLVHACAPRPRLCPQSWPPVSRYIRSDLPYLQTMHGASKWTILVPERDSQLTVMSTWELPVEDCSTISHRLLTSWMYVCGSRGEMSHQLINIDHWNGHHCHTASTLLALQLLINQYRALQITCLTVLDLKSLVSSLYGRHWALKLPHMGDIELWNIIQYYKYSAKPCSH